MPNDAHRAVLPCAQDDIGVIADLADEDPAMMAAVALAQDKDPDELHATGTIEDTDAEDLCVVAVVSDAANPAANPGA